MPEDLIEATKAFWAPYEQRLAEFLESPYPLHIVAIDLRERRITIDMGHRVGLSVRIDDLDGDDCAEGIPNLWRAVVEAQADEAERAAYLSNPHCDDWLDALGQASA